MAAGRWLPFMLFRSGTSRGPFFVERDVLAVCNGRTVEDVVLAALGSGHPQQLEGLGGGHGVTSKAVVVRPAARGVEYAFYQCNVAHRSIDPSHGDCGNMIAAVAPFAIESKLIGDVPSTGEVRVPIRSLNTGAMFEGVVTMKGGEVVYDGSHRVAGVPSPGAPVVVHASGIAGGTTGKLFPTGSASESIGGVRVTCIDFSRPLIIVDATSLGFSDLGGMSVDDMADPALCDRLEDLRREGARRMGMKVIGDGGEPLDSPKVMVASGCTVRYWVAPFRREPHRTVAMTAAQAFAAAAFHPETVVTGVDPGGAGQASRSLTLLHPSGEFTVAVTGTPTAPQCGTYTTTVRPVARGTVLT